MMESLQLMCCHLVDITDITQKIQNCCSIKLYLINTYYSCSYIINIMTFMAT